MARKAAGKAKKADKGAPRKPGRPPVIETPEELFAAADRYFAMCRRTKQPPTITGLALFLGYTSRQSLIDAANSRDGLLSDAIKIQKSRVEEVYERNLHAANAVGSIFALKNFGWKDKQEIEHRDGDLADRIEEARRRARG